MYTKMTPAEFVKYDWRIDVFLRKYKDEESFTLATGGNVKFHYDPAISQTMDKRNQQLLRTVKLLGKDGKEYSLSDLGKDRDFGGKGAGAGTAVEDMELRSLQKQLNDIRSNIAQGTIKIKVGNKVYDIAGAETTPGTPKSDFHLLDVNGKEVVWISHKKGRTAKDFQQWGGVSQRSEPIIGSHPEVQKFVSDLKKAYPQGLPNATSLYRKIDDDHLKNLSIYGNDYGKALGRQNVSILLQGAVKVIKSGSYYQLSANHVHFNGDKITGDYEPVLAAIYKGDRSDAGVKGTRIVIMPVAGRKFIGPI